MVRLAGVPRLAESTRMSQPAVTTIFDTLVWATDGRPHSDLALGYVREMCERHGSTLRIVHVARPLEGGDGERRIAKLKAMTTSLRRHGVNASLHVVRGAVGSPAHQIAEVARMCDADLLVVATRGRSRLHGAVGGSVAQRLLHEAPCPVLILTTPSVSAPAAIRWSA
jgi:nucleotide-binding universal stress UspA family protein